MIYITFLIFINVNNTAVTRKSGMKVQWSIPFLYSQSIPKFFPKIFHLTFSMLIINDNNSKNNDCCLKTKDKNAYKLVKNSSHPKYEELVHYNFYFYLKQSPNFNLFSNFHFPLHFNLSFFFLRVLYYHPNVFLLCFPFSFPWAAK